MATTSTSSCRAMTFITTRSASSLSAMERIMEMSTRGAGRSEASAATIFAASRRRAASIRLSNEALGRVVDQLYLRFLGRQSDPAGQAGFISFLQHGGTLETVENLFVTSPEYINHINTDFVQSLFLNIIGRPGSAAELAQ